MGSQGVRIGAVVLALAIMGLMASQASGVEITLDGSPYDWGIVPGPGGTSDWTPYEGVQGTWGGGEDFVGWSGQVYPGYGGQYYDAEAFYAAFSRDYAYFGIVTGFSPNPAERDGDTAGDIAIRVVGESTWILGIETTGNDGHPQGAVYATENSDWTTPTYGSSFPSELKSGLTPLWTPGEPSLHYLNTVYGGEHYFIEAAIPMALLPLSATGNTTLKGHWTMSCGNDEIEACIEYCPPPPPPPSSPVVPEPMTCTLLGGGLAAALAHRHRKRKSTKEKQAS